jgi:pyruvate dehydrogenase E1 component alpha subunit
MMNEVTGISGHNQPDSETLVEIFSKAMLIKLCDDRIRAVLRSGKIVSPHYSPRGQEVVSAAMATALRQGDYLVTIYRGLHDHLAKGVPLRQLWAEYAGRVTGSCKGKGGPMHITHPEAGVVVTTGIVGSGIPIANGLALASQVRGEDRVTVTNFGDGASNIGAFHEALNMASVWKLPVIFLCHNNRYAEHTRYEDCTAVDSVATRGIAYTMPGVSVDGNDPVEMYRAATAAVDRARRGEGPTLIEARTFRFEGHNYGDPGHYIPKDVYAAALADDPLPKFRAKLVSEGHADEARVAGIEAKILADIDDAVAFALASDWPEKAELRRDVFVQELAA